MSYKDHVYAHLTLAQAERFWTKVQICSHGEACQDCCWMWDGGLDPYGYGFYSTRLHDAKTNFRVTRLIWVLVYGEIPEGLLMLHRCDNPPCCNPAHLWVGTQTDNQQDSIRKGRRPLGEQHPQARLTEEQVRHLRQLRDAGWSYTALMRVYGSGHNTVRAAVNRHTWKYLDQDVSEESHD